MDYGLKYILTWVSQLGSDYRIEVLKKNYAGATITKKMGGAPTLVIDNSGSGIKGTSLQFTIQADTDGELNELYTTDSKMFKVLLYRDGVIVWSGYLLQELYSEEYIAPPYDVAATATDQLALLKDEPYIPLGRVSLLRIINNALSATGVNIGYAVQSSMKPTVLSSGIFLDYVTVDDRGFTDKSAYEVLEEVLSTLNMTICQQGNRWCLIRDNDIDAPLYLYNNNLTYLGSESAIASQIGQMYVNKIFPVGSLVLTKQAAKKGAKFNYAPILPLSILENPNTISKEGWSYNSNYIRSFPDIEVNYRGSYIKAKVDAFTLSSTNQATKDYALWQTLDVEASEQNLKLEVAYQGLVTAAYNAFIPEPGVTVRLGVQMKIEGNGQTYYLTQQGWNEENLEDIVFTGSWLRNSISAKANKDNYNTASLEFPGFPISGKFTISFRNDSTISSGMNQGDNRVDLAVSNIYITMPEIQGYSSNVVTNPAAAQEAGEQIILFSDAYQVANERLLHYNYILYPADIVSQWVLAGETYESFYQAIIQDRSNSFGAVKNRFSGVISGEDLLSVVYIEKFSSSVMRLESGTYDLLTDELSGEWVEVLPGSVAVQEYEILTNEGQKVTVGSTSEVKVPTGNFATSAAFEQLTKIVNVLNSIIGLDDQGDAYIRKKVEKIVNEEGEEIEQEKPRNFYSFGEVSSGGVGSESSGDGLLSEVLGADSLGLVEQEDLSKTFSAYAINSIYNSVGSLRKDLAAKTLGGLANVDIAADAETETEQLLIKTGGSWGVRNVSEIALNETKLGEYLTTKGYITKTVADGAYAPLAAFNALNTKVTDFLSNEADVDETINRWKELEAFLAGYTETATLADLLSVKADKTTVEQLQMNLGSQIIALNNQYIQLFNYFDLEGNAKNALKLGGVALNELFTSISSNTGNVISITIGGVTRGISQKSMRAALELGTAAYQAADYFATAEGLTALTNRVTKNEDNIKDIDDRLAEVEKWFTLVDDVLITTYNLAAYGEVSSGGVGSGSSGGSGGGVGNILPHTQLLGYGEENLTDVFSAYTTKLISDKVDVLRSDVNAIQTLNPINLSSMWGALADGSTTNKINAVHIPDLSSKYLPLSGGLVHSGIIAPLTIRGSSTVVALGLGIGSNNPGSLVYYGGTDWRITDEGWVTSYKLLHTGNYTAELDKRYLLSQNKNIYTQIVYGSDGSTINELGLYFSNVGSIRGGILRSTGQAATYIWNSGGSALGLSDDNVPFYRSADKVRYTLLHTGNYSTTLDTRYVTLGTNQTITGQKYFGQSVIFKNNNYLYWTDSEGTNRTVLFLNSTNLLTLGYGTSGAGYITQINGNTIRFHYGTSHTEAMRIAPTGEVLIGTTSSESGYKLRVAGNAYVSYKLKVCHEGLFGILSYNQLTFNANVAGGWARGIAVNDEGDTTLGTIGAYGNNNALSYLYLSAGNYNSTNSLRVYANGNVTIGASSDNSTDKLQVAGSVELGGSLRLPNNSVLYFKSNDGVYKNLFYYQADGTLFIGRDSARINGVTCLDGYDVKLRYGASNAVGLTLFNTGEVKVHSVLTVTGNSTFTGKTTHNGRIKVPTRQGQWLLGMDLTSAAINISGQITEQSYHPILNVKTYNSHYFSLGAIGDRMGLYGFKADRTENANDFAVFADITNLQLELKNGNFIPTYNVTNTLGNSTHAWSKTYTRYVDSPSGYDLLLCSAGNERLRLGSTTATIYAKADIRPYDTTAYNLGTSAYPWYETFTKRLSVGDDDFSAIYMRRPSANYIWASNTGGFICIGVADKGGSEAANASLVIGANKVYGGNRVAEVDLGSLSYPWRTTYTQSIVIGGATLTWDAENECLIVDKNFAAYGEVSSGGIGEESVGGAVNLLLSWSGEYDNSYALSAGLGVDLNNRVSTLEANGLLNTNALWTELRAVDSSKVIDKSHIPDLGDKYLKLAGGVITGDVKLNEGIYIRNNVSGNAILGSTSNVVQVGDPDRNLNLRAKANPTVSINSVAYTLLHTGNYSTYTDQRYLQLSGGKLTKDNYLVLSIENTATDLSVIGFYGKSGLLGHLGFNAVNKPRFMTTVGVGYDIVHSGNLLSQIQSIDGSGSGIDADMLDGRHSSGYMRVSNMFSATEGQCDLNTMPYDNTITHDYIWANAPVNTIGSVFTLTYSKDWKTQIFARPAATPQLYVRSRYNGTTWTGWREVAFTDSTVANATNADTLDGYHETSFFRRRGTISAYDADVMKAMGLYRTADDASTTDFPVINGPFINLAESNTYGLQFCTNSYMSSIYVRTAWYGLLTDWKTIAFTDSNITGNAASATKLQTARTLWGKSFDGTANVDGAITNTGNITPSATHAYNIGSSSLVFEKIYGRYIDTDAGYNLRLCANGTERVTLRTTGYVGINQTAPEYQLDVNSPDFIGLRLKRTGGTGYGMSIVFVNADNVLGQIGWSKEDSFRIKMAEGTTNVVDITSSAITLTNPLVNVVGAIKSSGGATFPYAKIGNMRICCNNDMTATRTHEINDYDGILHLQYNTTYGVSLCIGGGNVGIGSSPSEYNKLSVDGSIYAMGDYKVREGKNILLRPNNSTFISGIGYDTSGNECIALWAKSTATRLRWHAGIDLSAGVTSGSMMSITPDFEISKASGTAKGFIGGVQIVTTAVTDLLNTTILEMQETYSGEFSSIRDSIQTLAGYVGDNESAISTLTTNHNALAVRVGQTEGDIASLADQLGPINNSITYLTNRFNENGYAKVALRLSNSSQIGSATQPVYFDANGVPVACTSYADASVNYANTAGYANNAGMLSGKEYSYFATAAALTSVTTRVTTAENNIGTLKSYFTSGVANKATALVDDNSSNLIKLSTATPFTASHPSYLAAWNGNVIARISPTNIIVGQATQASKLTVVSKTAWGQTYWTSNGIPTSISGDMSNVGNINMSGEINIGGAKIWWDSANQCLRTNYNFAADGEVSSGGVGNDSSGTVSGDYLPLSGGTIRGLLSLQGATNSDKAKLNIGSGTAWGTYGKQAEVSMWGILYMYYQGYTTYGSLSYYTDSSGSTRYIQTNSNVSIYARKDLIYGGSLSAASDINYKNVIQDVCLSSEVIANAPMFTFTWRDSNDGKKYIGTSAQYWLDYAPELTSFVDNKYRLDYATLGVLMGKSNATEIEQLKEKVRVLEEKVERYEKMLNAN